MRSLSAIMLVVALLPACNPFAPGFDSNLETGVSILGDQTTVEGVFQNLKYAYTFRDTTIYGQLFNSNFTFIYRDYDRGIDVTWGRDEELRITHGLFRNVQRVDLVWNDIVTLDSVSTRINVTRGFNLTVTFNPDNIERADGYANLTLERPESKTAWQIVRWRDESNF